MEAFADAIDEGLKTIHRDAYAIVFGHAGDGNLHFNAKYPPPADKYEEISKLVYGITGEFAGSISAEHGIGILKRPYLKLSRTAEEIETMRTLKRALDRIILNRSHLHDVNRNADVQALPAKPANFKARSSSSTGPGPRISRRMAARSSAPRTRRP
jgi:hypothetical protein